MRRQVDGQFATRAKQVRDSGKANVIVGGASYGEGSSREHAAICPMFLGVKVVLAKSFQRIHTDNLVNFGVLPLEFKNESDYDKITQDDELQISNVADALRKNGPIVIKNVTKNTEIPVSYSLSERQREIILAGGSLSYAKQRMNR